MRRFYQPRFLLLLVSGAVILYCVLTSSPSAAPEECMASAPCAEEVPAKGTELLWESFSHQFVSAVATY